MTKAKIRNFLPIAVLAIIILFTAFVSIKAANAAVSFKKSDTNWSYITNKMGSSSTDTYPYDTTGITVNKVSLDVLYGTTRDLVFYHGEFPYDEIYDDDDEYEDGWEGYYAEDGTSKTGDNPNYGASATVSAEDYWGSNVSEYGFDNVPTAEKINESEVKSLRLYAASNTITGFGMWLNKFGNLICTGLAWICVFVISLIVRAKNLSMDFIMDLLNLDDLNETMTKNFIWDGDHVKLSAFTGFCIIILIFTLASFAVRWVRGRDKTQGIWEILGTVGLGLLIIGMCLTGRISSLGSSISTMASKVMYSVAQSLSTGGDGNAFMIDITDAERETEITQMCEMALVNKAFIDLQLCSQFNVSDVDELKFSTFGDSTGSTASSYLSGVSGASMKDDFNYNLGYYYWFANSSAIDKTSNNKTYPDTDTQAVYNKMSSMITYLQVQHNAGDATVKKHIEEVTLGLANPGRSGRFFCLLLFAIVLAMLAVVLFKYALNVVIAKIQLFIALLGMILAGPLILTSNKKLVETGKAILGMLLVSFMEITIYSIIFDIIMYTVSAMFHPDALSLLATMGILLLLLYFNPVIAQKIKQVMERTERKISPALVDGRRAAKNWAKNKVRDGVNKYDASEKVVGYDENGNAITESRGGNALSKLMHTGSNAVFAEGNEHEGLIGMHTKLNKDRQKNKAESARKIRENAEAAVEERRKAMYQEADDNARAISKDAKDIENSVITGTDENGETTYDEKQLSEEERRMVADRRAHQDELEELKNNGDYQQLLKDKADLDRINAKLKEEDRVKMSDEDSARLAEYTQKINAKKEQIKNEKKKVTEAIKERAAREAMAKRGLDYDSAAGGSIDEKIKNATKKESVDKHRDELEKTLKASIDAMSNEVNNTTLQGKIGRESKQTVNKTAAEAQAAAMLQLSQLQNGEDVSTASDAKEQVRDIVDKVSQHYDKDRQSNDARIRETLYKEVENAQTQQEYDAAMKAYNEEVDRQKAAHKEQKAEVKGQYKDAKKDAGRVVTKATVQEQLQSAINNRTSGSAPAADSTTKPDMATVVNNQEATAPKTTINLKPKANQTQAQPKPQPASMYNSSTQAQAPTAHNTNAADALSGLDNLGPAPAATRPTTPTSSAKPTAAKPTPGRSTTPPPARPNVGAGMYGNTPQQPDMGSVINQRESVSATEARQGEARQAQAQQDMNSIIEEQTMSITHEANRRKSELDESKMDAYRKDSQIIRGIHGDMSNNGGRQ